MTTCLPVCFVCFDACVLSESFCLCSSCAFAVFIPAKERESSRKLIVNRGFFIISFLVCESRVGPAKIRKASYSFWNVEFCSALCITAESPYLCCAESFVVAVKASTRRSFCSHAWRQIFRQVGNICCSPYSFRSMADEKYSYSFDALLCD